MDITFTQVLNLSISASWLVLAVALIRLVLKKAPKAYHCALWALVAIRLLCPISLESELSLVPSREVIPERYLSMEPVHQDAPAKLEIVTNPVYDLPVTVDTETTVARVQNWDLYATILWLTGMCAMAIYAAYSYLNLRLRVRMAGWVSGNVWACDELDSPFILGILRPRIYLPAQLDGDTRQYVLAHENARLKRLDHLWKPLGFLLLTIHWFNPVMWLAYALLCRDIELACDERVIKKLEKPAVRAYSEALVSCSVSHRMIAVCPLAFGEVGVKGRVRSMLRYKKPGFRVLLAALAALAAVTVFFLTDPPEKPVTARRIMDRDGIVITSSVEEALELTLEPAALPEDVLNGKEHVFEPGTVILRQFDSTIFYVSSARMSGDELLMEVRLDHTPAQAGSILLSFDPLDDSAGHHVHLDSSAVTDSVTTWPDAAVIRGMGREGFSLCVKMDVFKQAQGSITFQLGGIYCVTYAREDMPLAALLDQEYRVAEVLYTHPGGGFAYTPEQCPTFAVRADLKGELYLSTYTESAMLQRYGAAGFLQEIQLTQENLDDRFAPEGWADEDLCQTLRRENLAAWRVYPKYTQPSDESLLLLQTDGSVWLAYRAEPDGPFANLYRLTPGSSGGSASSGTVPGPLVYSPAELEGFSTPRFTLCADGTFTLTPNLLSSYLGFGVYSLTEEELILRTEDGLYAWYFHTDGDRFRFDGTRSSPLHWYSDARTSALLPDGTIFASGATRSAPDDALNAAIEEAILTNMKTADAASRYCATAWDVLGTAEASGTPLAGQTEHASRTTVYLHAAYQEFSADADGMRSEYAVEFPAALTFDTREDGYSLTEYWVPGEDDEITARFPQEVRDAYFRRSAEQVQALRKVCARRTATAAMPESGQRIAQLLDAICASPAQSSNPGAYIDAHPEEYAELLDHGCNTLLYAFRQFAGGGQTDLRGHIMAIACREVLADAGYNPNEGTYMTGQDWFDYFAAYSEALCYEIGLEKLTEDHYYRAVALELLGI